jgi:nucleotide-binding universal stress UspA family protein
MKFSNIIIPFDFSSHSQKALEIIKDDFEKYSETRITLVHVIENFPDLISSETGVDVKIADEYTSEVMETITEKLNLIRETELKDLKNVNIVIEAGKPENIIVHAAKNIKADLIIMGSHGSGNIIDYFFGSTAYNVSRKAHCSVMIVKI